MRILAVAMLSMYLMAASCTDESSAAIRRSEVARSWIKQQPDSVQRWVLHSTFDPYDKGYTYPRDSANPQILELATNGVFHEYDTAQQSFGQWFINTANQTINLRYEIRNNIFLTNADPVSAYKQEFLLARMSEDSLVMETQGRHGMLVFTYLPFSESSP